ncbi:MAG: endolytic transglycosylase MltG [Desulfobulbus sp.]
MRHWLIVVFTLLFSVGCGLGLWYGAYLVLPAPAGEDVVVVVPKGTGVRGIGTLLAEQGLLKNDLRYLVYVALSGTGGRLQAGEYRLPRGKTPPEILELLVSGRTLRHRVTIPEGLTVAQIARLFAQGDWVSEDQFRALASDRDFVRRHGVDAASLEGYLFPETYTLSRGETSTEGILTAMVRRYREVWQDLGNADEAHGLGRHQLLILASVVEKETGVAEERPLIARVFLNRLALGMRLQSDPTVIYGIADFDGNLRTADLRRKTPYNTYAISGLPAGPICNPGRAALEAVLHPVDSPALYFVSKNDGTHEFSTNLKDHNSAVHRYQRGR